MFNSQFAELQKRHEQFSTRHFETLKARSKEEASHKLASAMAYSMLNGGKRVRPFLVYATGAMLGADLADLDAPALAIECIHSYSLVHDDLPAMDNDTLRRGKPTCHIKYDHATAILAGDALQAEAFQVLTTHAYKNVSPQQQLNMVRELATASGLIGMCGGQALDIEATGQALDLTALEHVHQLKTGALMKAAVLLGAHCAPQISAEDYAKLQQWSDAIGLAFQVQDDILDQISDTETLGKTQGSDITNHKATYPALLGLEGAIAKRNQLFDKAVHALSGIPYNTQLLSEFTEYLVTRDR
ncbi:(2E,6E)-farnesyl diphosphate synthase [Aliidiomarina taiwanensis]|uniref:(2E,6E)-farnesyl diphosphate synthase n=1 Tax=Aliidiomarina taiwanensis TaxID=946228 RepID=A0A432X1J5_9GAMM|nr:farnesyl diphosphate synthase [Aliidiomarina taiwanensis]RUO40115.1 (2E,6E)-farnesyl diphosphate synthase [Aliidiomarina taiwanensis]